MSCSDCRLGAAVDQLNSPFGYSDSLSAKFISLASSCSEFNYSFTKPLPYTTSTSTSPSSTPSDGKVLVTAWPVMRSPPKRALPPAPGSIPSCLEWRDHEVSLSRSPIGNQCSYIVAVYDLTLVDFLAWNPSLAEAVRAGEDCKLKPGFRYCVDDSHRGYV